MCTDQDMFVDLGLRTHLMPCRWWIFNTIVSRKISTRTMEWYDSSELCKKLSQTYKNSKEEDYISTSFVIPAEMEMWALPFSPSHLPLSLCPPSLTLNWYVGILLLLSLLEAPDAFGHGTQLFLFFLSMLIAVFICFGPGWIASTFA